ncbi:NADH-quinone oxidoreductase subunit 5 family protein [Fibrella aquatilis]|uniref:NADH-quinone oxidoreductase subunit L n=1 Tax=Fibrella aquatilis TaxID=2817059 RepID=A0A939K3N1_9BACT|nr:NADH-quinone oxidoreductase subunit L [Fibrella aquatilis]MBO0934525.1 NADH-quinone oxidoreductase subunit L [Fibrella aquatilis]
MPDSTQTLLLTALLGLPFVGAMGIGALRNRISGSVLGVLAVASTAIGLFLALTLARLSPQTLHWQTDWITFRGQSFPLSFQLDPLSKLMLVVVHGVALLVQLYSIDYMRGDARIGRYFAYLQLFVGAMLGIVLAGNLLILYGFWELVGLASYLLIGFWYHRPSAARAATKAFLMNRIGDAAFLLGILLTYVQTGSVAFGTEPLTTAVGLCLFMGCVAKSAQFPLLTWLPDAMEGPTPVSALLHAATMVAAGIVLLARIHPMLSPDALTVVAVVGTVTALWGGFSALFQLDIKRVLAFSTVSQLGLMVAGMGTGNVSGALFHLLTHACFKAGLFLAAGSVIHAVHTQDMRAMGGLRKALPYTFAAYVVCAAALAGVPLLSGFLSKEVILAGAYWWAGQRGGWAMLVPVGLLLSSVLTAVYMARQLRLVFWGERATTETIPHESGWLMRGPVLLLAVLSVGIWFSLDPLSAHHSPFFAFMQLPVLPEGPAWLAPVSMAIVAAGGWLGFRLREPAMNSKLALASFHYGYLDQLYQALFINPIRKLANFLHRADHRAVDGLVNGLGIGTVLLAHIAAFVDRVGVDGLVNGAGRLAVGVGQLTRSVQGGRVQTYIATAVAVVLFLLWWIL